MWSGNPMVDVTWYRRRYMTPVNMLFCWHVGLTMMLAWWAAVLAYPAPTFSISQSYSEFAYICPDERFWATGFGVAAALGAVGCWAAWPALVKQQRRDLAAIRMCSVIMIAIVHGLIAMFMLKGAPTGTGSGIYVLIMCSAYLLLRAEYERS